MKTSVKEIDSNDNSSYIDLHARRWHRHKDERSREKILDLLQPRVRVLARQFDTRRWSEDDLEQAGMLAVSKSLDAMKPDEYDNLIGFCLWQARIAMLRSIRGTGKIIKEPVWVLYSRKAILPHKQRIEDEAGREATIPELMAATGWEKWQVVGSLTEPVTIVDGVLSNNEHGATGAGANSKMQQMLMSERWDDQSDSKAILIEALSAIDSTYRDILQLYIVQDKSVTEIAKMYNMSESWVYVQINRAKSSLRQELSKRGVNSPEQLL